MHTHLVIFFFWGFDVHKTIG